MGQFCLKKRKDSGGEKDSIGHAKRALRQRHTQDTRAGAGRLSGDYLRGAGADRTALQAVSPLRPANGGDGLLPRRVEERLAIRDDKKRDEPQCRVVLLVDDADRERAESVKRARKEGLIDAFIYSSVTDSCLAAMMDSL